MARNRRGNGDMTMQHDDTYGTPYSGVLSKPERRRYLLESLADWRDGHDWWPSEWGEFSSKLNMTDAEEKWLLANEGT